MTADTYGVPHHVYRCYGPDDELLYVGVTRDVTSRFYGHKTAVWRPLLRRIELEPFPNEAAARERERQVIETLRPLHNRPLPPAKPKATTNKKGSEDMSTTIRPQNVWTSSVTARQAREVSRVLKAQGYDHLTIATVRELAYVNTIAEYCEPGDLTEQNVVRRLICEAAGIQPRRLG